MADAKQGKSPMEDFCNGSSQSRVVLAKPRLGSFGSSSFASSSNKGTNPFGSILRPPQLKPGANPFLKVTETEDKDANKEKPENESNERLQETNQEPEAPKFVPLGSANVTARTTTVPTTVQPAATSSASFVFGQNLSDRVVIKEPINNGEASSTDHCSSNGTSELLFTSAAASVKETQDEGHSSEPTSSGEGLAAAAAEYERSHARPPPPTTNFTITGEEGETNVLQISCRLFAWEAGSWTERGRGVLRLNDASGTSRLVARAAGSLRVLLNTQLWRDMVVQRAGVRSLRLTAADAQQNVKIYLVMGAPGDIVQLYRALTARVATSKRSATSNTNEQNSTSQQAAERLEAVTDDNDYVCKVDDDEKHQNALESKVEDDDSEDELDSSDRLQVDPEQKTEQNETEGDSEKETKSLKRKEPAEDETSPKRQCPEILIE